MSLKNELMKIFRVFQLFEYALMVKDENLEMSEINKKLSKQQKKTFLTVTVTRKLLKNYEFVIQIPFWLKSQESHFQGTIVNDN